MAYASVIETTTNSATVEITGMDTSYPYKQIVFMIALPSDPDYTIDYTVGDNDYGYYCGDGTYTYTYTGLDPDTTYVFRIQIGMRTSIGHFEIEEWGLDGQFTTESGGGGGGSWVLSQTYLGNITSELSRLEMRLDSETLYLYEMRFPNGGSVTFSSSGSADTRAWLSEYGQESWDDETGIPYDYVASDDDSGSGNNFEITYTCDANVSYYLWFRTYNGAAYSGAIEITITPSGGGGGGDWQLYEESAGVVSSSFTFPYYNGFEGMTLYRMSITFSQNVTVTFSTSGNADTIGWLSEYDQTTWDDSTGRPDNYVAYDDDSGSGSNFEFSYTCTAGYVYYLWYRTYGDGGYTGNTITLSVSLGAPAQQWSYDGVSGYSNLSSEAQKNITLSSMVGQYFGVSFRDAGTATISAPSGANIDLFVTDANYSYDTSDGYPFDYGGGKASSSLSHNINVTAGATYYVWVKGATSSIYGNVTITLTPQATPTGWEEVYVGDVNVTTTDRSFNRSCAMMKVYRYNVRFSTAGKVRIYSTGATSSSDVIAYWGTSNSGVNTSNGVPYSYDASWDDDGSDRNFNSGEITVSANTNYYLWVRCYRDDTTAQITIYFTAPTVDTGRVWIYTSSGWRQATPYIYTNSGWVKAAPYVYTSSGWKKCT